MLILELTHGAPEQEEAELTGCTLGATGKVTLVLLGNEAKTGVPKFPGAASPSSGARRILHSKSHSDS